MTGLFAAVATPLDAGGRLDEATLDRLLDFLVSAGVTGVCLGGATSEYPHVDAPERIAIIRRTAARLPPGTPFACGIGAPSIGRTLDIGRAAIDAGCRALLLPMPMFFRYRQEDLHAYCSHVSRALSAPCLLYDLPDFTNGLAPETAIALMRDEPFISGIKDSGGREENLAAYASARGDRNWALLVGDDRLLTRGLRAGWSGGISGVAGFCPELLVALYRSVAAGTGDAERLEAWLDELIDHIAIFPTPWGIRIGLAARGIDTGPLPLPLTDARRRQAAAFAEWFPGWLARTGLTR